jgi:ABC-type multidrug transport system fused ATPase/permease subunit
MYDKFFNNFFIQNKNIVIINAILTILIYPLELVLLSYLSGNIFYSIKNQNTKDFIKIFVLFAIAFIIISVLFWLSEKLDAIIIPKLQTSIRKDILNNLFENNINEKQIQSGDLINKLNNIPKFIFNNYVNLITYIMPLFFTILFFTLFMFFIHYYLGIISLVFFIIFSFSFHYFMKKAILIATKRYDLDNQLMNRFEDVIKNHHNVTSNNTRNFEKLYFYKNNTEYQNKLKNEFNSIYDIKIIFVTLIVGFFLILTIIACFLFNKEKITLFKLIIFVTAIMLMIKSFQNLIRRTADSISYIGPLFHNDELAFFNQVNLHKGHLNNFFTNFEIKLINGDYQYKDNIILKNVNLTIPFKSRIVITGDIGSGKSTFFKILTGYLFLNSGQLLFDNININDIDLNYLRSNMTIMTQNITLFDRSVLENIFYGDTIHSHDWLIKYNHLKSLSIYDKLKSFLFVKNANKLSGGQKQIVLLLRSYFKKTKFILLDEPTANVNSSTKDLILEILNLCQDSTIICITHDNSLLSYFSIHYELKNYTFQKIK